ncbi:Hypothetical predicted protein, partial [Pelobates cultripes]
TLHHIWWNCMAVTGFWKMVWKTVNLVTGLNIPYNQEALILFHFKFPHRQM